MKTTNGSHSSGGHHNRIHNHITTKRGGAMKANRKSKVKEAMQLLNEAAQEQINKKIGTKYTRLKEVVEDGAENAQFYARQAQRKIGRKIQEKEKQLKETAAAIDRKVKKNPWAFAGGVAAGSFVAGLVLGSKKRGKKTGGISKLKNVAQEKAQDLKEKEEK